jgi:hypothetical protein
MPSLFFLFLAPLYNCQFPRERLFSLQYPSNDGNKYVSTIWSTVSNAARVDFMLARILRRGVLAHAGAVHIAGWRRSTPWGRVVTLEVEINHANNLVVDKAGIQSPNPGYLSMFLRS